MVWTHGQNGKPPRRRLHIGEDRPSLAPEGAATARQAAFRDLGTILEQQGADAAARRFRELRGHDPRSVGEDLVNTLGYALLAKGNLSAAIQAFKLNIEAFPESFNAQDSLAEAYVDAGEIDLAILHYRRSVELNPGHSNGMEILERLRRESFFEH